jgi:hypothetical protein
MPRSRRTLASLVLLAALVAALAFAAVAAAETKIGEGTSPEEPKRYGEADLLKASAEFDVDTGTATFQFTTRAASESVPIEERQSIIYLAALLTTKFECSKAGFEAATKEAEEKGEKELPIYPMLELVSPNQPVTESPLAGVPVAQAYSSYMTHQPVGGGPFGEKLLPASKALGSDAITLSGTNVEGAKGPFTCGIVEMGGSEEPDLIVFPLTVKPEPPAVVPVTPEAPKSEPAPEPAPKAAAPAPAPAPGVLTLARTKPLKLPTGRTAIVKVTVSNSGGSPIGQGFLSLRAPKGVIVKGRRQRMPALLPGDSWTLSYRVRMTAKAKSKSTIGIVGAAGALTANGSLVITSTG